MPPFDVERFRGLLRTRLLGHLCLHFEALASTNSTLQRMGRRGAREGTLVVADRQTAGRGRGDKVWLSTARGNLYVSILLRPELTPAQAPLLSLLTAVALVDALGLEGVVCGIKWPNDVLIQQRKVAGILTEMEWQQEAVQFVVVGVGVNVNMTQQELEQHLGPIADTATSLQVTLGREIAREGILATFIESLERWYDRFVAHGPVVLQQAWEARSLMHGRRIRAATPEAIWEGVAEGIDSLGHLHLRREDGALIVLSSAEIRFLDAPDA